LHVAADWKVRAPEIVNIFPLSYVIGFGLIASVAQGLYLSQKMSLQQVLAPQLQQSLALLQAPTLEFKALVEQ